MEGSPQEIRDVFADNGLNAEDYLERPESPIKPAWLFAPGVLVVLSFSWLTLLKPISDSFQTFLFLIGCGAGIWLSVCVQIRFKSPWAAGLVAVSTILIMLVAIGVITPREMLDHLKDMKQ